MGCSSSIQATTPTAVAPPTQQGATKPQPVTPDSRVLRGQAYFAAGKVSEAFKELNAAIASWPTYARAYLERGNVRLDQCDYSLAIGDYTMALQLQGNLIQAYMMRCHARMALRQYAEALQDTREAERLDPDNAQVKVLKAQVRKAQAGVVAGSKAVAGGGGGPGPIAVGPGPGGGEEQDAFAGLDTPKSTPSPSVRKLCMVCMDAERECRLRPCMHAALCLVCADGLMVRGYGCPICSSKIDQVERGSFMRTFTVEEAQGVMPSARVTAPAASPGKSPLGRRVLVSSAPLGSSLDNIVEGDEEGHNSADIANGTVAAILAVMAAEETLAEERSEQRRRISSSSAASSSGRATTPPVSLDPYPLAGRTVTPLVAARWSDTGMEEVVEQTAESRPPPPLPGEVVLNDEGEVDGGASWRHQRGSGSSDTLVTAAVGGDTIPSTGTRSGGAADGVEGGSDGGVVIEGHDSTTAAATVAATAAAIAVAAAEQIPGDGESVQQVDPAYLDPAIPAALLLSLRNSVDDDASMAALTVVASTFLANSLADWIDEHGAADSPSRPVAASGSPPPLVCVEEDVHANVMAAVAVADDPEVLRRRQESFCGFSSSTRLAPPNASKETEPGSDAAGAVTDKPVGVTDTANAGCTAATPLALGGPVAEGHCIRPVSAHTVVTHGTVGHTGYLRAEKIEIPGSGGCVPLQQHLLQQGHYHHQQYQHQEQQPYPSQHCQQRPHRWSARALAARTLVEATSSGGGAYRALAGAYASCSAAAAARPISRERPTNVIRAAAAGSASLAVGLSPAVAATARPPQSPQPPSWNPRGGSQSVYRSGSGSSGSGSASSKSGSGSSGNGSGSIRSGKRMSENPRMGASQRRPSRSSGGGVMDVVTLPGAIPV